MIACEASNYKASDQFVDVNKSIISGNVLEQFTEVSKPITGGKGNVQNVLDYHLSRYACYLIVQNSDPRKESVALGQTYFAIQTRKMELTEQEYSNLSED